MDKEGVLQILKDCQQNDDTERGHMDADDAIAEFLRHIGYSDVADEFDKVPKWFA